MVTRQMESPSPSPSPSPSLSLSLSLSVCVPIETLQIDSRVSCGVCGCSVVHHTHNTNLVASLRREEPASQASVGGGGDTPCSLCSHYFIQMQSMQSVSKYR